ncbi:LysR family transcriptional regulator [Paraburkholderia caballeronis]|uniref:DNA-binding transcriptional regulator, LysR family n=1 Tax=Paraburkholderia caballeronis TaxID=416943 RepID=A0A1H7L7V0_9BURK|nr:LysR family transcriptional regulator [Paraburkholderia caballeronis]PXW28323.1 DNA-binding transcriptional LysR family regulator [Paraburkholderia caballeronis]PXX03689.1 DNA-binding transcriptional LysR family regulator [Paraburkholderia caballeronis]RAK04433.1 DNA-binding transcriptional LysR family regulator [Paraburkholderia caballeronis]SED80352.1 DNA-binding transcriptional regulator, LysR family [Paraburkholderia caballeronis]SEK94806.1 DNA-binding transcriptional regulator, LysR fa
MDLRSLRIFVEVVRQGGFTDAAKVVFSTQSTVSKVVKQLEEELGCQLLDRSGKHIVPTPAGRLVHEHALEVLRIREALTGALDELHGVKRGIVRLGVPRVGSDLLFAPICARFRSQYPGIDVKITEDGSVRLREALQAGELDLAGLLLPVPDELEYVEMSCEPVVAILPREHPLARAEQLGLEDFRHLPVILFDSGFALHTMLVTGFKERDLAPKVITQSSQISFMIALAAAGLGATFMPRSVAVARMRPEIVIVPLDHPTLQWRMAIAWRRIGFLSTAAQAWANLAKEVLRPGTI